MNSAAARRAWWRWQTAAGPWQGWSICPALLAPDVEHIAPAPRGTRHAGGLARALEAELGTRPTLVALRLEPELGVQVAADLAHLAHPVLLIPRWPYPRAVLDTAALVGTIISSSQRLPRGGERLKHALFVLDVQRGTWRADRVDNRYRLSPGDLPDLRTLRQRGISRVLQVFSR